MFPRSRRPVSRTYPPAAFPIRGRRWRNRRVGLPCLFVLSDRVCLPCSWRFLSMVGKRRKETEGNMELCITLHNESSQLRCSKGRLAGGDGVHDENPVEKRVTGRKEKKNSGGLPPGRYIPFCLTGLVLSLAVRLNANPVCPKSPACFVGGARLSPPAGTPGKGRVTFTLRYGWQMPKNNLPVWPPFACFRVGVVSRSFLFSDFRATREQKPRG